jgi:eukaryotic-like serine/threonine-protein kinase
MVGQALGHYTVESQLGAGGMGVVYLAADRKLGRRVALKVLHDASLRDAEQVARLGREARLLASLSHSNIATIYGFETAGDTTFLVLEYVAGETLAERLARGPLGIRETLNIGRQIAEALEAAHQRGIIHRDLKPANVKITPEGQVKVLDFGIAKALAADTLGAETVTATRSAGFTQAGTVIGTVAYMSPEQASGSTVDARTDVWALGCLLFEMLTGTRTFAGGSTTDILIKVLDRDPEWTALPTNTPDAARRLLRRCLAKDLRRRLHSAADARLELEDALSAADEGLARTAGAPNRGWQRVAVAAIAIGVAAGAAAAGLLIWRRPGAPTAQRVTRFAIDLPHSSPLRPAWGVDLTFSPDSQSLLYPVATALHVRRLDELDGRPLIAAAGLRNPIYSPDGRSLLTPDYVKGSLVKVPIAGGARQPIAPVDMFFRGHWNTDGYIYVTTRLLGGISRVPESGGPPESVTTLDDTKQERSHRYATVVPGSAAMLFTVASADTASYDDARIDVIDLPSKRRKTLIHGGTYARYSPSGHIVYARAGSLFAVPFRERGLEVSGEPLKVVDGVLMSTTIGTAYFDISRSGDLAYAVGPAENGGRTLHWVDRRGRATPLPLPPRPYLNPRISPDGKRLAIEIEGANHDFYVYDFDRGVMSRFTTDGASHAPIWTADGGRIAYRTWQGGMMTISWLPADRSGPAERLVNYTAWQSAVSFSPDGKYLAFDQYDRTSTDGGDIWVLPLRGDRQPRPVVKTAAPEGAAKFSPDGKWLLYSSMESGRPEIYVQAWPGPGAKIQISSDGGTDPMWRRDGREIFYRNETRMMAVPVGVGGSAFSAGKPQVLWTGGDYFHGLSSSCGWRGTSRTSYDVSPDGERFLMIKDADANLYATKIAVIVNWVEELKRMAPEYK